MKSIRKGTFETNSSSTHSLTIVPESEFRSDLLESGYFDDDDNLISREEAIARMKESGDCDDIDFDDEDAVDDALNDTFSSVNSRNYGQEYFEQHFVSPSGDKMVAFGWYGHD